jgi:hypothetical protein
LVLFKRQGNQAHGPAKLAGSAKNFSRSRDLVRRQRIHRMRCMQRWRQALFGADRNAHRKRHAGQQDDRNQAKR